MIRFNHSFTSLLAVLLAMTFFPFSALALTEDTLEPAPEISLPEETGSSEGISGEDFTDAYMELPEEESAGDSNSFIPPLQLPPDRRVVQESAELDIARLTNAELAKVKELLAARDAGELPAFTDRHYAKAEKVFEAGVYPLDPADFGGRTFYVILPRFQMDQDQLLSLIAAFEELGIPFDPDSLDSINCIRGYPMMYSYATRELSSDEQARMAELQRTIRSGVFDREAFTAPSTCFSTLVRLPGYTSTAYEYLHSFCFYPYRAMTDDELAAFALAQEVEWEIPQTLLEKNAREFAHKVFRLPLSMTVTDVNRYAYSEEFISFLYYFSIQNKSGDSLYSSPEETPARVMVEQHLLLDDKSTPPEASVASVTIDYPYDTYENEAYGTGSGAALSEEELKAAADRWAEKYLPFPEEDILSEWAFDTRYEDLESVQYRLLTRNYLVCLEMLESNAQYCRCSIYERSHTVEYDDWVLKSPAGTGAPETAVTEETAAAGEPLSAAPDFDQAATDAAARRFLEGILNLPAEMAVTNCSFDREDYPQYRIDYSVSTAESTGSVGPAGREPAKIIAWLAPYFAGTYDLNVNCAFLNYPSESASQADLTDAGLRAAAQAWADKTLKVPAEEILEDWTVYSLDESNTTYHLDTVSLDIYLKMGKNGEYLWCGLYNKN